MDQNLYHLNISRIDDRAIVEAPDVGVFQSYRVADWLRASGSEVLGDLKDNLEAVRQDFSDKRAGCDSSRAC